MQGACHCGRQVARGLRLAGGGGERQVAAGGKEVETEDEEAGGAMGVWKEEAAAVAAPEVEAERLRAYAGCGMERPLCDACSVVWSLVLSTSRLFQASCRTIRVPTNRRLRMIRHEAWLGARRCMPRARARRPRRRRAPSGCRRALLELEGWKVRNTLYLQLDRDRRAVPGAVTPHSYRHGAARSVVSAQIYPASCNRRV